MVTIKNVNFELAKSSKSSKSSKIVHLQITIKRMIPKF